MSFYRTSRKLVSAAFLLAAVCSSSCVQNTTGQSGASSGNSVSSASTQPATSSTTVTSTPTATNSPANPPALLAAHNQWRAKVGVPALQWSENLAARAQQWASQLAASNCSHSHSPSRQYGENIFFASAITWPNGRTERQNLTPQHVVDDWGSESSYYNYASNQCSNICGHYTQLVWRATKEVGCGMAVCANNAQIWVCNYSPAGNQGNQKPY